MLLIIGINSIIVTCYNSLYVIFLLFPTYNIYRFLTVLGGNADNYCVDKYIVIRKFILSKESSQNHMYKWASNINMLNLGLVSM